MNRYFFESNSCDLFLTKPMLKLIHKTKEGSQYCGDSLKLIKSKRFRDKYKGKINLIITSPPFDLTLKKEYGNLNGQQYIDWLSSFAEPLSDLLTTDGSIVIELGNSFDQGSPTFSTIPMEALLSFKKAGNLYLCQEFICHNPARLPSPAEWVTVRRIRLKDSYTRLWWFSKTPNPKADNKKVLREYSSAMLEKFEKRNMSEGKRPSGHVITKSFNKNNGGSIQSNYFQADRDKFLFEGQSSMSFSNADNQKNYHQFCLNHNLPRHPAKMQKKLIETIIRFMTDPGDVVFDPFSGSNTTGSVAESLERKWISCDMDISYILGSLIRFYDEDKCRNIIERMAKSGIQKMERK